MITKIDINEKMIMQLAFSDLKVGEYFKMVCDSNRPILYMKVDQNHAVTVYHFHEERQQGDLLLCTSLDDKVIPVVCHRFYPFGKDVMMAGYQDNDNALPFGLSPMHELEKGDIFIVNDIIYMKINPTSSGDVAVVLWDGDGQCLCKNAFRYYSADTVVVSPTKFYIDVSLE